MIDTHLLRDALQELKMIVRLDDTIDDNDGLAVALAEVDIEIGALQTTIQRGRVPAAAITLKTILIERRLANVALDILGYFALPVDAIGSNEAPVGGSDRGALRSKYIDHLATDEMEVLRLRDQLTKFLSTLTDPMRDDEQ